MNKTSALAYVLVVVALPSVPFVVHAERFEIVPETDGTEVVFHSKATMESFEGSTRHVEGWIDVVPAALDSGVTWNVSVDVATLDTGIGLRNRHMRENHLHTDEHPTATFAGEAAPPGALRVGTPLRLELEGDFTLHGVTVARSFPLEVELQPDGSLSVLTEFEVSLAAHEIPRPKFLILKLADEQRVEVRIHARPVGDQS